MCDRQARFFGYAFGCEEIGIAPRRDAFDLHIALADAIAQAGIDEPQRYSKFRRHAALGLGRVTLHGMEEVAHNPFMAGIVWGHENRLKSACFYWPGPGPSRRSQYERKGG